MVEVVDGKMQQEALGGQVEVVVKEIKVEVEEHLVKEIVGVVVVMEVIMLAVEEVLLKQVMLLELQMVEMVFKII